LNAWLEREGAEVERERAQLAWLHARVEARAALLERERLRAPARCPRGLQREPKLTSSSAPPAGRYAGGGGWLPVPASQTRR
jgi:hypothetical protein